MCEPTTIMMGLAAAGAATSAISAINQGKQAQAEGERMQRQSEIQAQQAQAIGNYQQAQAQADADTARGEAEIQARKIREASKLQRSAAIAASAGSGLSVSDGTAELINYEIIKGGENDALTTILSGNTRARQLIAQGQGAAISGDNSAANARAAGAAAKASGDNAMNAGYLNAATSALKFGSTYAGGWKSVSDPVSALNRSNRRMID